MKLKIGSRKSDLARIQAYAVGDALRNHCAELGKPLPEIDYIFKSSLGDEIQDRPLASMPEKGVFTQDLTSDLNEGRLDLVVHSWKDLPTDENQNTTIAATLPRADHRDMLVIKRTSLSEISEQKKICILTSSPRRSYNLGSFLTWALPIQNAQVQFKDVRGNILTRFRKLFDDSGAHGLVVAKAAVDRLLTAEPLEFGESTQSLRGFLNKCQIMILPFRENPPAAAQGALAIEIKRSRSDLREILKGINCRETYEAVTTEREFLASKGGGCHQKIGVTRFWHPNGWVFSARGKTDSGETINSWRFDDQRSVFGNVSDFFPKTAAEGRFLKTENVRLDQSRIAGEKYIWLAKGTAWPADIPAKPERMMWVAGSETWKKMAKAGHWVTGSCEGLGDTLGPQLDTICGENISWVKLTHIGAIDFGDHVAIGTYALVSDREHNPDLEKISHFFWTSFSNFEEALSRWPQIRFAYHATGPGQSADLIRNALGPDEHRLQVFLSYDEWRERMPRKIHRN